MFIQSSIVTVTNTISMMINILSARVFHWKVYIFLFIIQNKIYVKFYLNEQSFHVRFIIFVHVFCLSFSLLIRYFKLISIIFLFIYFFFFFERHSHLTWIWHFKRNKFDFQMPLNIYFDIDAGKKRAKQTKIAFKLLSLSCIFFILFIFFFLQNKCQFDPNAINWMQFHVIYVCIYVYVRKQFILLLSKVFDFFFVAIHKQPYMDMKVPSDTFLRDLFSRMKKKIHYNLKW